jgi:dTMP kinase
MVAQHGGPGLFVTFEGGDGAGKSTQIAALAERLRAGGYEVLTAREPGGTPIGEQLRAVMRKPALARRFFRQLTQDTQWSRLEPMAELFLFEAARVQLVAELVRPALEHGAVVLLDRFTDSTLAYQGYGRGIDLASIRSVNALATENLRPDLTLLLDLDVELGLARNADERGRDAIGQEARAFHERVRAGYLALAVGEPDRWVVLDGSLPPEQLGEQIWNVVTPRIQDGGKGLQTIP